MSEIVEVRKSIDVDMAIQIDYVTCAECSKELDFNVKADGFGDLQITVEKCDC